MGPDKLWAESPILSIIVIGCASTRFLIVNDNQTSLFWAVTGLEPEVSRECSREPFLHTYVFPYKDHRRRTLQKSSYICKPLHKDKWLGIYTLLSPKLG